jgi:hypothetical protein
MKNSKPESIENHFNKYWETEGIRFLTSKGVPTIEDRAKDAYSAGFMAGVNALKQYINKSIEK